MKVQQKTQKKSNQIARIKAGLPPEPPTEVQGDPVCIFAHDSLLAYACFRWAGYMPAAHHQLIAKYLEKVESGEIKRLMIFQPPRSGKSMLVSEYFPAWFLGRNPDKRVVAASYGQELASDFGRKVRNQISDPVYGEIFPEVGLSGDSAAADKFDLNPPHQGGYVAVGVGGALTGRGAHCLTEDTQIFTDHGLFLIGSLYKNLAEYEFKALSYNHQENKLEFKYIFAAKLSYTDELIEITLYNEIRINATPEHLFCCFVRESCASSIKTEYVFAKDLSISSVLVGFDFAPVTIKNIKAIYCNDRDVYDIQVVDNHNFFANGVLVHNCLIIDDPIKGREDSDSEAHQRRLKDWYTAVAYTRLMDDGAIIICQTRWNVNDLSGWLLKEHKHENWTVLNLPAINDQGEALWPEKYPLDVLHKIKKTLPERDWQALYQQKPFVEEGNIYKRQWWKMWPDGKPLPECVFIIQSYDTAFSDKERKQSSYSARVTLGVFKRESDDYHNVIVLERWKDRVEYPELRRGALEAHQDYAPDKVIIENKASGRSLIQDLRRAGLPLATYTPEKDKITRAYAAQSLLENGRCYYPARQWAEEFIGELARFPNPEDDDVADAFSQAIIWLQNSFLVAHSDDAKRRQREDEEEDLPDNVTRFKPKKRKASYG